jgi:DNA-binding CsgD family transcriptional regulator
MVVSAALLTYIEANIPTIEPALFSLLHYGLSVLGFILLFTIPLLMHYLIDVPHAAFRNIIFGGIALGLAALNYGKTYDITGGDSVADLSEYLEGMAFMAVIVYTLLLGFFFSKELHDPLRKKMTKTVAGSLGIAVPFILGDVLLEGIHLFPMFYCGLSIVFTRHFLISYLHQSPREAGNVSEESPPRVSAEDVFQHYNISPREQEVLRLVLQGNSNQQIGDALFISLSTVKKHISNIYLKCDVKSRYELIAMFKDIVLDQPVQSNNPDQ